jgi:iron complex outermembrane recepter protein
MTLVTNNVDLRPEYSDNFDFSLEYYFKPVGLLSVGVFLKEISDFVYRGESSISPDSIYYESYQNFTQQTFLNGGYARVRGAEFAYQQQFSNLHGFWRGFGVFANYTWLETEGDYGNIGNPTDLVGFVPRSGNVGVSYTGGGFTIRAKANYQGKQLWVYNVNPVLRRYRVPRTPLDLNISYAWSPRLNVFVDVLDVFESPLDMAYLYEPSRRQINAMYGRVIKFGVSGRF